MTQSQTGWSVLSHNYIGGEYVLNMFSSNTSQMMCTELRYNKNQISRGLIQVNQEGRRNSVTTFSNPKLYSEVPREDCQISLHNHRKRRKQAAVPNVTPSAEAMLTGENS